MTLETRGTENRCLRTPDAIPLPGFDALGAKLRGAEYLAMLRSSRNTASDITP